jgi:hypothetical protein
MELGNIQNKKNTLFLKKMNLSRHLPGTFLVGCVAANKHFNKGNAKRGVSPRLKIRPCDLENK